MGTEMSGEIGFQLRGNWGRKEDKDCFCVGGDLVDDQKRWRGSWHDRTSWRDGGRRRCRQPVSCDIGEEDDDGHFIENPLETFKLNSQSLSWPTCQPERFTGCLS